MSKALTLLMLISLSLFSPFLGAMNIDLGQIFVHGTLDHQIFFELRLPRLLLAFFSGVLLALSGWLFQTLFRNALMTPYTLGISGGAVLGTGIAVVLGLNTIVAGLAITALFGFGGALLSVVLLLWLSRYIVHRGSSSLLLLGIALSFFFSAALMVLFSLASAMQSHAILHYTMGSLSTMGYTQAVAVAFVSSALLAIIYTKRFELSLLGVNEEHAKLKGIDTRRLTHLLLLASSLGIGMLISVTGPIGFVGLIIPHMVRKLYRRANHHLIIPTALFGGLFLSACDTLSRLPQLQSEIPIGIVTAFIGGPFFIYLIIKGK
ncbi:MAG: iron ABC transporter permease [Campylobacterota bacterium]|nr:iron ABC transporter permease [Campylobacterota bacterium]